MIDRKKIMRQIRDLTQGRTSVKDHNIMHPEREWFIGTLCALVLICLGVFWAVQQYQFYSAGEDLVSRTGGESAPVIYREQTVAEALELLATRRDTYDKAALTLTNQNALPEILIENPTETATSGESGTPEETPPLPVIIPRASNEEATTTEISEEGVNDEFSTQPSLSI